MTQDLIYNFINYVCDKNPIMLKSDFYQLANDFFSTVSEEKKRHL